VRPQGVASTRKLALVGAGDAERLLPVLDLQHLARSIRLREALA
jgi:hypothetical protein